MDIVIKEHPSTSRLALLEGFVDAHFDPETGAPACGGFFEVFTRLGRKDLNFGLQAQKLGRLSTEEETFVRDMYSDRCNDARNAKKHLNAAFSSIANDCRENPFYKQLSTAERLVFQALSADGKSVVNPAAATTLAQAVHERWFEVPNLFLSPTKLLRLCANQGDAHAAYLLATRQTPDEVWLEKSATARKKYLDHANWVGHQSAYETIRQVEEDEWRSDFQSDEQNEWFLDYEMDKWREATERAPTLEGEELLDMGILLNDASFSLMIHNHPDFSNETAYEGQVEIALGWIRKAAATSSRAKHWLATEWLFNHLKVADRIDLLSEAAWPMGEASPFRPALVDLAEIYAKVGSSTFDANRARECLKQALGTILDPEPSIAIRLADLDEELNPGLPSNQAYKNYASATKFSAYAAFRAGVLALRNEMVSNDGHISHTHFEACVEIEIDDSDKRSRKAKTCAEVALLVGWGGGRNSSGDLSNDAWNDAAVLLVQQLAVSDYQTTHEFGWLIEEDIERLVAINPQRRQLMYVDSETNADEDISTHLKQFKENNEYAYGSSHPVLFLRGIIAASTIRVCARDLEQKHKVTKESTVGSFILAQLYLNGRFGAVDQVRALEYFELTKILLEQHQFKNGGQGFSLRADSLRWIEQKAREGILRCQPNVRSLNLTPCGQVNRFGDRMMSLMLGSFPNEQLPGKSLVKRVVYRDRYINTPFKVALLAFWMRALKKYLYENHRWQDGCIEIEMLDEDHKAKGSTGQWNDRWFKSKDRDEVLSGTLKEFGVDAKILTSKQRQHDRELIVEFLDSSRLTLALGHGLSYWKAEPSDRYSDIKFVFAPSTVEQVKSIVTAKVKAMLVDGRQATGFLKWEEK